MVTFYRMIKAGVMNFRRNIWLSSATVLVLTLSLSVALGILLFGVVVDGVVAELESKVDISVYFKQDASDQNIVEVRDAVGKLPEVLETRYTSRDDALSHFKDKHAGNDVIQSALAEISSNPLEASLAIRASDANAYDAVNTFLEQHFSNVISKVNYRENSSIIQKIFSVTNALRIGALAVGIVLFFVAGLVAFNTIRLAIYSVRSEISVMRLVGASNWFIRGPFIIEGILSGLVAAVITFGVYLLTVWVLRDVITQILPGVDLLTYYKQHWAGIFGIAAGLGVATSIFSSAIAIRRYLRV